MMDNLYELERILKDLSKFEKQGLDTSYLKSFIRQYKTFIKINDVKPDISSYSDYQKFNIIREIMNDKIIFPTINHIIYFANEEMELDFKSQNASREITIDRILKRVEKDPEFKHKLKKSLIWLLSVTDYNMKSTSSYIKSESNSKYLDKWVKMLKEL
ncbi:hypothetical protein [Aeromonas veronii]|uniref:hypothetical protein n=1 Tax=Aeromonas veronii TaxID=654 RepID=UPI003BF580D0